MCINQLFATEEKIKKEKVRLFLRLQKEQRGALTSAVKLGLITETKEEYVAANNKYVDTSKLDQIQEFKWRIFKSILQDENAKPYTLKKGEKGFTTSFITGLCWFSFQRPGFFYKSNDQIKRQSERDIQKEGNIEIFQNKERVSEFKAWLNFFDLVDACGMTDYSNLLHFHFKDVFTTSRKLNAKNFFDQLAKLLPFLDYGVIFSLVKSHFDKLSKVPLPEERQISITLSRALLRLEKQNILKLTNKDDLGYRYDMFDDPQYQKKPVKSFNVVERVNEPG